MPSRKPNIWSFPELQARIAIHNVTERCFELGAASIKLSHGFIALLSDLSEISSVEARSRCQSLAAAIEDIMAILAELQKAATTVVFPKFAQAHKFTWVS